MVIIGAGGLGREVLWVLRSMGPTVEVIGFLDDNDGLRGTEICDVPVIGPVQAETLGDLDVRCAWGVGFPKVKRQLAARLPDERFLAARHPTALMSDYVHIGEGTVICAGVVATTQVQIGSHVLLNLNVTIGHDAVIEDYCTLNPGTHVSGYVYLEEGVDVGTGAVFLPGIRVGAWSVVGAGAVVTKDVPAYEIWAGNPAHKIGERARPDAD